MKCYVTVVSPGCWLNDNGSKCSSSTCVSNTAPRMNDGHFCCCRGYMCNTHLKDIYTPEEHPSSTSSTPYLPAGEFLAIYTYLISHKKKSRFSKY